MKTDSINPINPSHYERYSRQDTLLAKPHLIFFVGELVNQPESQPGNESIVLCRKKLASALFSWRVRMENIS